MGKIIDLEEVRMQTLRKELETYQEAIQSAKDALAMAEAELGLDLEEEEWEEEYVSEDDVARENGCYVDDDGNWIPLDEDDDW